MIVCQYLSVSELLKIASCSKLSVRKCKEAEFDGLWVITSFHSMYSKTGYTGLRNHNLKRID